MIKKKQTPLVYLAGAIENAPDSGKTWRSAITPFLRNELNHDLFNPCLEENHVLTPHEFRHFREWKSSDLTRFRKVVHKIIDTDLTNLIQRVNYVICLWDEYVLGGGGTPGELTTAYLHHIPVYLVAGIPVEDISSWIIGCSTKIFEDFGTLKEYLKEKYPKPNGK